MHKILLPVTFLAALAACGSSTPDPEPPAAPEPEPEPKVAHNVDPAAYAATFGTVSAPEVSDAERPMIELGRQLYYDERLSAGQNQSCNSCHVLTAYGVDNEPTSPGSAGERGVRNSPTVYHAADHVAQFWDGRAADLAEQAKGPILNPVEMGMPDEATVVELLKSIPGYVEGFSRAFPEDPEPVSYDNLAEAIAAFEEKLATPAPVDAFLAGDPAALTKEQAEGLQTFVTSGCTACHSGPNFGGAMFMKLGQVEPWPTEDEGRKEATGKDADAFFFKVPSLRNVTKTGPYLHDGSITELDEMVRLMGKHQLGRDLSDTQVDSIVAFLGALEGELPAAYIAEPKLPENGPTTPGPLQ